MSELKAGVVLDQTYVLVDQIGRGGMGEVWRARHLRLPKQVAIKVLAAGVQDVSEAVARFRREAEIASRLGHPNIIETIDFNELDDGRSYLVMELLDGEDLRDRLARGPIGQSEAITILKQVASALQVAHETGVVHRDLKPGNIFLCTDKYSDSVRVKVLDFGISKVHGSQMTQDERVMGTPAYMSPEQAQGKNTLVDARTDQFALAAIAYEMFSGAPGGPFHGSTFAEEVYNVISKHPEPLVHLNPDLPPRISSAIERAIAKDPADRFDTVRGFFNMLTGADALPNEPPSAPSPRALEDLGTAPTRASIDDGTAPTMASADNVVPPTLVSTDANRVPPTAKGRPVRSDHLLEPRSVAESMLSSAEHNSSDGVVLAPRGSGSKRVVLVLLAIVGLAAAFAAYRFTTDRPTTTGGGRSRGGGVPTGVEPDSGFAERMENAIDAKVGGSTDEGTRSIAHGDTRAVVLDSSSRTRFPRSASGRSASGRSPSGKSATKAGGRPSIVSSAVAKKLAEARAALSRGAPGKAIGIARRTLSQRRTSAAFEIMARGYCAKRDLGMAQAMLRNANRAAKVRVRAYCRKIGVLE